MKWICQKSAETLTIPVTTEYLVVVYSPDCFITRHILVQKNNLITFPNFWGQSRHKRFFLPLSYDARTEIEAVCHSLNILVPLVQIKRSGEALDSCDPTIACTISPDMHYITSLDWLIFQIQWGILPKQAFSVSQLSLHCQQITE